MATCRSDDLSDQEGEAAGAEEGDHAAGSESHSPRSRESGSGSESSSGSDTSSASELADLEDEQEALRSTEVEVTAPRAKRRRAAASSTHDADLLERRYGISGKKACTQSMTQHITENLAITICVISRVNTILSRVEATGSTA